MYKIYGLYEKNSDIIRYIGLTRRCAIRRMYEHIKDRNKCHRTNWLKSINYNVEIYVIEDGIPSIDDANFKEKEYIKLYKSFGANLVNSTDGGDGIFGFKHSETTKKKLSELNKGKILTTEHKDKMSKSRTGLKRTKQFKLNCSVSKLGIKNHMYGKFGKEHHGSIPILKFTKDNIFIKEYSSIAEAQKECNISHISSCLSGNRKTAGGYIWKKK